MRRGNSRAAVAVAWPKRPKNPAFLQQQQRHSAAARPPSVSSDNRYDMSSRHSILHDDVVASPKSPRAGTDASTAANSPLPTLEPNDRKRLVEEVEELEAQWNRCCERRKASLDADMAHQEESKKLYAAQEARYSMLIAHLQGSINTAATAQDEAQMKLKAAEESRRAKSDELCRLELKAFKLRQSVEGARSSFEYSMASTRSRKGGGGPWGPLLDAAASLECARLKERLDGGAKLQEELRGAVASQDAVIPRKQHELETLREQARQTEAQIAQLRNGEASARSYVESTHNALGQGPVLERKAARLQIAIHEADLRIDEAKLDCRTTIDWLSRQVRSDDDTIASLQKALLHAGRVVPPEFVNGVLDAIRSETEDLHRMLAQILEKGEVERHRLASAAQALSDKSRELEDVLRRLKQAPTK